MKPKARIVSIGSPEGGPRARVVDTGPSRREARAKVISVGSSDLTKATLVPEDISGFVNWARKQLGVESNYGFYIDDIQRLVEKLSLTPTAILWERHHWMLITRGEQSEIGVYDPTKGLDARPYRDGQKIHLLKEPGDQRTYFPINKGLFQEQHYAINEEPLRQLGAIQKTDADCGPLVVYAARVARREML